MSIALAKQVNADLVLAAYPDGNLFAFAGKNKGGDFETFIGKIERKNWSSLCRI
jgi:hypothetical protein